MTLGVILFICHILVKNISNLVVLVAQITNVTRYGNAAFEMNPWEFFIDQLIASSTTLLGSFTSDSQLLWKQNVSGLDIWALSLERFTDYFISGAEAHSNLTDGLTKTG